jgi:hypothetical protein
MAIEMGRRAIALTKLMFKFNVDIPKDPIVNIQTTENRGFTPDEVAERCVEKLISVSDTTHPAIRDQAQAFKKHMEKVVAFYMREAIRSDRTTVYNALKDAGHPKLAELIRYIQTSNVYKQRLI